MLLSTVRMHPYSALWPFWLTASSDTLLVCTPKATDLHLMHLPCFFPKVFFFPRPLPSHPAHRSTAQPGCQYQEPSTNGLEARVMRLASRDQGVD